MQQREIREQLISARAQAKKTGRPLRERLDVLLRGQPANVTRHILRSHGVEQKGVEAK